MAQMIAKSPNVPPCNSGSHLLRYIAEPDGRFTDPSQTALHRINRLFVLHEGGLVHTGRVSFDARNILEDVFDRHARITRMQ